VSTGGVGNQHVFQQITKHKSIDTNGNDTSPTAQMYVREGGVQQTLGSSGYDGHVSSLGPSHPSQNPLLDVTPPVDDDAAPITTIHNLVGTSEIFSSIQPIDLEYVSEKRASGESPRRRPRNRRRRTHPPCLAHEPPLGSRAGTPVGTRSSHPPPRGQAIPARVTGRSLPPGHGPQLTPWAHATNPIHVACPPRCCVPVRSRPVLCTRRITAVLSILRAAETALARRNSAIPAEHCVGWG
jgi:hypothetical protein